MCSQNFKLQSFSHPLGVRVTIFGPYNEDCRKSTAAQLPSTPEQLLSVTHYNSQHGEKIKVHSSENITIIHHGSTVVFLSLPSISSVHCTQSNSLLHSAFSYVHCHYCLENYYFYNMGLH